VFILKVLKVLCFDTLLQVLILKVDRRATTKAKDNAPFEAQGKEPRRTRRCRRGIQYPTPPVLCEKRLQTIENKGKEMEKERQEILRGGKLLKH
jgi:hypothetical protein